MEYRILALYRFVPLVTPSLSSCEGSTGCGGDGSNGRCNDGASSPSSVADQQQQQHKSNHHPPELLALQTELTSTLKQYGVKGTLLLAPEGINGTICYPYPPPSTVGDGGASLNNENGASISAPAATNNDKLENDGEDDPVASYLKTHPLFGGPELRTRLSVWKEEENGTQAFHRLKIKIKAEIVTLGLGRPLVNRKPVPLEEYEGDMSAATTVDGAQVVVDGSITNMDQVIANEVTSATKNETRTKQQQQQQSSSSSSTVISTTSSTQKHHSLRQTYNELSNPLTTKGQYLNPKQWDTICINNPDVLVIDTRNTYEIDIGTFKNAVHPMTENFSDFPRYLEKLSMEYDWSNESCVNDAAGGGGGDNNSGTVEKNEATNINEHLENNGITDTPPPPTTSKKKPPPKGIAMFCTGGIRCEKATSYAIQSNLFPSDLPIYHLEGGVLAYLDDVAKRGDGDVESNDGTKDVDGTCSDDNGAKTSSSCSDDKKNEKNGQAESSSNNKSSSTSSTFHGECFVFDKRVAVTAGLRPTSNYVQCHGCRGPMDRRLLSSASSNDTTESNGDSSSNIENMNSEAEVTRYNELSKGISHSLPPLTYDTQTKRYYLPGLTCPRCHASTTRESLVRFVERERQVEICRKEGRTLFCEGMK